MMMMTFSSVAAGLTLLIGVLLSSTIVEAFPTGAGGCTGGAAAVSDSHLTNLPVTTGTLSQGERAVKIDGVLYTDPAATISLVAGTQYLFSVETTIAANKFKGALLRIQCTNSAVVVEAGTSGVTAGACMGGVKGITHSSSAEKLSVDGYVTFQSSSQCTLDVTVVDYNIFLGGSRYWYSQYQLDVSAAPAPPPAPAPFICFSGASEVQVHNKGPTRMDQLQIGDKVLTTDWNGGYMYSPVYSFGHYAPHIEAEFLQIVLKNTKTRKPLEITSDHMLYRYDDAKNNATLIPARSVKVGDMLVTATTANGSSFAKVQAIHKMMRVGIYAPLTETGDIAVNDIVASNYVAIPLELPQHLSFDQQWWIQHLACTPYRWYCSYFGCKNETYDEDTGLSVGMQFWVPVLNNLEFLLHFFYMASWMLAGAAALYWMGGSSTKKVKVV